MFWNVTFIYNAFIRTTDHCKVQTAFVSLFYIFIIMLFTIPLEGHAHSGNYRIFSISEKSLKFANFFCWGNEFSIYSSSTSCHLASKLSIITVNTRWKVSGFGFFMEITD